MNIGTGNEIQNPRNGRSYTGKSILIALPALLIFLIFLIIPFIASFMLAFKQFIVLKGLSGSPWVGTTNFSEFFQSPAAGTVIGNTFIMNILSLVIGSIYVFVLTYGIAGLGRRWMKALAASLVILPALIPGLLYIPALSGAKLLLDPSLYRLTVIAYEVFTIAPIAVLMGVFACIRKFDMKKVCFVTIGFAAVRLIMLFSSDLNYILSTYNPLVYQTGDVIDTYVFRQGLINANYSATCAVYIIKVLLQLIPAAIGTTALILLSRKMDYALEQKGNISQAGNRARYFSIAAIIPAALFAWAIGSTAYGNNVPLNPITGSSMVYSTILSIVSCILAALLALCLAYGLTAGSKFVIIANALFLLLAGNITGQYLHIKSLGMVNTYFSIIFSNCLYAAIGALCIYFALGRLKGSSFGSFFVKALPVLITLLGFGFAKFYGNVLDPMMYLSSNKMLPLPLALRNLFLGGGLSGNAKTIVTAISFLVIPAIVGIAGIWAGIMSAKASEPDIISHEK